jgi:hypothetical protein
MQIQLNFPKQSACAKRISVVANGEIARARSSRLRSTLAAASPFRARCCQCPKTSGFHRTCVRCAFVFLRTDVLCTRLQIRLAEELARAKAEQAEHERQLAERARELQVGTVKYFMALECCMCAQRPFCGC